MKKAWIIVRQGTKNKFPNENTKHLKMKYPPKVVHFSYESALEEAKRLAKECPGEDFMIFESVKQVTYQYVPSFEIREPSEIKQNKRKLEKLKLEEKIEQREMIEEITKDILKTKSDSKRIKEELDYFLNSRLEDMLKTRK